mmetsp:Transcript_59906/g.112714  ORF Transcript_59906/g.112714 Transcript_59906/m.112714 type:complete len:423 (+) Transcript_59906:66-1334(+)
MAVNMTDLTLAVLSAQDPTCVDGDALLVGNAGVQMGLAQETIISETRQMVAVLAELQRAYAICLEADTKCKEAANLFNDDVACLKDAIKENNWTDAKELLKVLKLDLTRLTESIRDSSAIVEDVAGPALHRISREKWWLDVKRMVIENRALEHVLVWLKSCALWGSAGFLVIKGAMMLILALPHGAFTIPAIPAAGTGPTIAVGPFVPSAGQVLTVPYAVPEVLVGLGPSLAGFLRLVDALVNADAATTEAIRCWFRRHRESALGALDRAEECFNELIERARNREGQKEAMEQMAQLLDDLTGNCENGDVLQQSVDATGSVRLQARLEMLKTRAQDLVLQLEGYLEILCSPNRSAMVVEEARSDPQERASSSSRPHPDYTLQNGKCEQVDEGSHRQRRSHRQRTREKKWRNSVQIRTPEQSD